jgi:hypothetical protein
MNDPIGRATLPATLTTETWDYLNNPSLQPLWGALRNRLEGNGLQSSGMLAIDLGETGTELLGGILGRRVVRGAKIRLAELDTALRQSAAGSGLVTLTAALTGPLEDRKAARDARAGARASASALLDAALGDAGLGNKAWVPAFVEGVRLAGVLTKAGDEAAVAIADAGAVLAALAATGTLGSPNDGTGTTGAGWRAKFHGGWVLAELASTCTGDAHGLDAGRIASSLVLRAAAASFGVSPPESANDARNLWSRLGVTPDEFSGTALVWALRPPGADAWSAMMRDRADLGLVTHLTLHELRGQAAGLQWADTASTISVCENPQVLQAAARAEADGALVCTSGNPSSAGWALLKGLVAQDMRVRYHGDFDWPGMEIALRVLGTGIEPWRLAVSDYTDAVDAAGSVGRLPLVGTHTATPWDPRLAAAMSRIGIAIHEEALLESLLSDIQSQ